MENKCLACQWYELANKPNPMPFSSNERKNIKQLPGAAHSIDCPFSDFYINFPMLRQITN
jgi:hypothetical protein